MKKINIASYIALALALILSLGVVFLFHACAAHEDGSYMACHWAERAILMNAVLLAVLELVALFSKDGKVKLGIFIALCFVAISIILIPNTVFSLCMMPSMRCRTIMRPTAILLAILYLLMSLIRLLMLRGVIRKSEV